MAYQPEDVKQKLSLEIEFAEEAMRKVMGSFEKMKEGAASVNEESEKGVKKVKDMSNVVDKDLHGAFNKLTGALGPFAELIRAGGPIAAGVATFLFLDDAVSKANKSVIDLNNSFFGLGMTLEQMGKYDITMSNIGIQRERSGALMTGMTRSGVYGSAEQVAGAAQAVGAYSQYTGVNEQVLAGLVDRLIRTGQMSPNNIQQQLGNERVSGLMQRFAGALEKTMMSMPGLVENVAALSTSTYKYNSDIGNSIATIDEWHKELNRSIFSIQDLGSIISGAGQSMQAKIFLAQRLKEKGIEGTEDFDLTDPLALSIQMERFQATAKGSRYVEEEIKRMSLERAFPGQEEMPTVGTKEMDRVLAMARMMFGQLGPQYMKGLVGAEKGEEYLYGVTELERPATEKQRIEGIKERTKEMGDYTGMIHELNSQFIRGTSIVKQFTEGFRNLTEEMVTQPATKWRMGASRGGAYDRREGETIAEQRERIIERYGSTSLHLKTTVLPGQTKKQNLNIEPPTTDTE